MRFSIFFSSITLVLAGSMTPAHAEDTALYDTILAMDAKMFDAFNNRDIETTADVFSRELEFFHDTGGVTNYDQAMENSRRLFDANTGLRRELIQDSMTVYPIPNYGAIQVGKHRFCHPANGEMDCGVFEFMHIWKQEGDTWRITKVVSYGH